MPHRRLSSRHHASLRAWAWMKPPVAYSWWNEFREVRVSYTVITHWVINISVYCFAKFALPTSLNLHILLSVYLSAAIQNARDSQVQASQSCPYEPRYGASAHEGYATSPDPVMALYGPLVGTSARSPLAKWLAGPGLTLGNCAAAAQPQHDQQSRLLPRNRRYKG